MHRSPATALLVAALVVLLLGGATTAFVVGRDRQASAAAVVTTPAPSPSPTGPAPQPSPTPASSAPATTSPATTTPPRTTPRPTTSATPTGPAPLTVAVSAQAAGHPDAAAIRELVRRHFVAINTRDYQLWVDTVTPEQSAALTADEWAAAYATTVDSDVAVLAIDGNRWVTMSFRSEQAPEKSPDGTSTCLLWRTTQPAVDDGGRLRLAKSVQSKASHRPCSA